MLAFILAAATLAHLEDGRVTESSGVVASRRNPGIYWTHNDSGDGAYLYAFDLKGRRHGRWLVRGAENVDWEDIAIGPGPQKGRWYLYIGDIGDNNRRRKDVVVYRVEEPQTAQCSGECRTGPATAIRLRYADGAHNAEALLVHPQTGDLYIVSKAGGGDSRTGVYRPRRGMLRRVADLDVPDGLFTTFVGGITGGEISPDGRRVVLCDYFRAYEAMLPAGAAFDNVWKQEFKAMSIGIGLQVEGICYRPDGQGIIATSEGRRCPILDVKP